MSAEVKPVKSRRGSGAMASAGAKPVTSRGENEAMAKPAKSRRQGKFMDFRASPQSLSSDNDASAQHISGASPKTQAEPMRSIPQGTTGRRRMMNDITRLRVTPSPRKSTTAGKMMKLPTVEPDKEKVVSDDGSEQIKSVKVKTVKHDAIDNLNRQDIKAPGFQLTHKAAKLRLAHEDTEPRPTREDTKPQSAKIPPVVERSIPEASDSTRDRRAVTRRHSTADSPEQATSVNRRTVDPDEVKPLTSKNLSRHSGILQGARVREAVARDTRRAGRSSQPQTEVVADEQLLGEVEAADNTQPVSATQDWLKPSARASRMPSAGAGRVRSTSGSARMRTREAPAQISLPEQEVSRPAPQESVPGEVKIPMPETYEDIDDIEFGLIEELDMKARHPQPEQPQGTESGQSGKKSKTFSAALPWRKTKTEDKSTAEDAEKSDVDQPKSPFLDSVTVEKRPLSAVAGAATATSVQKYSSQKPKVTTSAPKKNFPKFEGVKKEKSREVGPTVIVSQGSRMRSNIGLGVAITLTSLVGGVVGICLCLILFQ